VAYLELGEFKVSFNPQSAWNSNPWPAQSENTTLRADVPHATIFENQGLQAEADTLSLESQDLRQDQVEELILTDPAEYERRMLNGDFTDEEDNDGSGGQL
jgi:hypothetical protein